MIQKCSYWPLSDLYFTSAQFNALAIKGRLSLKRIILLQYFRHPYFGKSLVANNAQEAFDGGTAYQGGTAVGNQQISTALVNVVIP